MDPVVQAILVLLVAVVSVGFALFGLNLYGTWWPPIPGGVELGYFTLFARTGMKSHRTLTGYYYDITNIFQDRQGEAEWKALRYYDMVGRIRELKAQPQTAQTQSEIAFLKPYLHSLYVNSQVSFGDQARLLVTRTGALFTSRVHFVIQYGNLAPLSEFASTNPAIGADFLPFVPGRFTRRIVEGYIEDIEPSVTRHWQRLTNFKIGGRWHKFYPYPVGLVTRPPVQSPSAQAAEVLVSTPKVKALLAQDPMVKRYIRDAGRQAKSALGALNRLNLENAQREFALNYFWNPEGRRIRPTTGAGIGEMPAIVGAILGAVIGAYSAGVTGAIAGAAVGGIMALVAARSGIIDRLQGSA